MFTLPGRVVQHVLHKRLQTSIFRVNIKIRLHR